MIATGTESDFYPGDLVLVKNLDELRNILLEDSILASCGLSATNLEKLALQIGTVIDLDHRASTDLVTAKVALYIGETVPLPLIALRHFDPAEHSADSPTMLMKQRPIMRRSDSFMGHDLDGEQLLVQQIAANSIQNTFRRYRDCKEHIKLRRITSRQSLVHNLAASTITSGMRTLLRKKYQRQRIRSDTAVNSHGPSASPNKTSLALSTSAASNTVAIAAINEQSVITWLLRVSKITVNGVPNVAWRAKNDLFCSLQLVKNSRWSDRTFTIEHAGDKASWEAVQLDIPVCYSSSSSGGSSNSNDTDKTNTGSNSNDSHINGSSSSSSGGGRDDSGGCDSDWEAETLLIRVYHETLAAADKFIGEVAVPFKSIAVLQEHADQLQQQQQSNGAVDTASKRLSEVQELSLTLTDGNKFKPRLRGSISIEMRLMPATTATAVECTQSSNFSAEQRPERRPSVALKDSSFAFLQSDEMNPKKKLTRQLSASSFTSSQLQTADDVLNYSEKNHHRHHKSESHPSSVSLQRPMTSRGATSTTTSAAGRKEQPIHKTKTAYTNSTTSNSTTSIRQQQRQSTGNVAPPCDVFILHAAGSEADADSMTAPSRISQPFASGSGDLDFIDSTVAVSALNQYNNNNNISSNSSSRSSSLVIQQHVNGDSKSSRLFATTNQIPHHRNKDSMYKTTGGISSSSRPTDYVHPTTQERKTASSSNSNHSNNNSNKNDDNNNNSIGSNSGKPFAASTTAATKAATAVAAVRDFDPYSCRGRHVIDEAYRLALKKECAHVRLSLRDLLAILRHMNFAVKDDAHFTSLEASVNQAVNPHHYNDAAVFADADSLSAVSECERNQPETTPRTKGDLLHRVHSMGSQTRSVSVNSSSGSSYTTGPMLLDQQYVDLPLLHSVSLAATLSFILRDYNLLTIEMKHSTVITEAHTQQLRKYLFSRIEGKFRNARTVALFACEGESSNRAQETLNAVKGIVPTVVTTAATAAVLRKPAVAAFPSASGKLTRETGRGRPSKWSAQWAQRFLKALQIISYDSVGVENDSNSGSSNSSVAGHGVVTGVDIIDYTAHSIRQDAPSHPTLRALLLADAAATGAAITPPVAVAGDVAAAVVAVDNASKFDVRARFKIWQQTLRFIEAWWDKGIRPEDVYIENDEVINSIAVAPTTVSYASSTAAKTTATAVHDATDNKHSWGKLDFPKYHVPQIHSGSSVRPFQDHIRTDCRVEISEFKKLLQAQVAFNRGFGWGCSVDGITYFASNAGGLNGYLLKSIESLPLPADDCIDEIMRSAPVHVPFRERMTTAEQAERSQRSAGEWVLLDLPSKNARNELVKLRNRWPDSSLYCKVLNADTGTTIVAFIPVTCLRVAESTISAATDTAFNRSLTSSTLRSTKPLLPVDVDDDEMEDSLFADMRLGAFVRVTHRIALLRCCERFDWWDSPPADVLLQMAGKCGEIVSLAELRSKRRVGVQILNEKQQLCDALPLEALQRCSDAEVDEIVRLKAQQEAKAAARIAANALGFISTTATAADYIPDGTGIHIRKKGTRRKSKSATGRRASFKSSLAANLTTPGYQRSAFADTAAAAVTHVAVDVDTTAAIESSNEKVMNRRKGRKRNLRSSKKSSDAAQSSDVALIEKALAAADAEDHLLLSPPALTAPALAPAVNSNTSNASLRIVDPSKAATASNKALIDDAFDLKSECAAEDQLAGDEGEEEDSERQPMRLPVAPKVIMTRDIKNSANSRRPLSAVLSKKQQQQLEKELEDQEQQQLKAQYAWLKPPERSPLKLSTTADVNAVDGSPHDPHPVFNTVHAAKPPPHPASVPTFVSIKQVEAVFDEANAAYTDGVIKGQLPPTVATTASASASEQGGNQNRPRSATLGGRRHQKQEQEPSTNAAPTKADAIAQSRFGLSGVGYKSTGGGMQEHAADWFNNEADAIPQPPVAATAAEEDVAGSPNGKHYCRSGAMAQRKNTRRLFNYSERKQQIDSDDAGAVPESERDRFGIAGASVGAKNGTTYPTATATAAGDSIEWSTGGVVRIPEHTKPTTAAVANAKPATAATTTAAASKNRPRSTSPRREVTKTTISFNTVLEQQQQKNEPSTAVSKQKQRPTSANPTKQRSSSVTQVAAGSKQQRTSLAGYLKGVDIALKKDDEFNSKFAASGNSTDPQYADREQRLHRQATAQSQREALKREDVLQRQLKRLAADEK